MASRRTRIKGLVANIPQRRKVVFIKEETLTDPKVEVDTENSTRTDTKEFGEDRSTKEILQRVEEQHLNSNTENLVDSSIPISSNYAEAAQRLISDEALFINSNDVYNNALPVSSLLPVKDNVTNINEDATDNKDSAEINIRSLHKVDTGDGENVTNVKIINQVVLPPAIICSKYKKQLDVKNENTECEMTLNEVNLVGIESDENSPINVSTPAGDKGVKKLVPEFASCGLYTEKDYPPPPPSPSKFNRTRIKAVPRFSQRKTSFSASESEDESRRHYKRIRNDSVSSVTGGNVSETISEVMSPQQKPQRDGIRGLQKKINRSEQFRRVAEARREFHKRFGINDPDKQRLKMIDLIFYNPSTNPMSINKQKPKEVVEEKVENQGESQEEETEDPKEQEKLEKQSDEEDNEMPVPQIKIGPSGEIILDEQSLVIERKDIKQAKEDIEKSALVDGDFDTGYGIYKRVKRSKQWDEQETLRFYKALNIIGTDFSLMSELFPKRTRRELKMKFKKEEKLNPHLVDKAVMQPSEFDYAILKHEVDLQEKEMAEIQKIKEEEARKNKEKRAESAALRKKKFAERLDKSLKKSQISNEKQEFWGVKAKDDGDSNMAVKIKNPRPVRPSKPVKKQKPKLLTINSVLSDSDADESDVDTHSSSESEGEVIVPLKPTRSGRVPKSTLKLMEVETNERTSTISNIMRKTRTLSNSSNASTENLVPGSIMIVPEDGSSGNTTYKIYMVTPDRSLTLLDVDSDVVSKAIKFKENEERARSQIEEVNNITIPADNNSVDVLEVYDDTVIQENTENDTNTIGYKIEDDQGHPIKTETGNEFAEYTVDADTAMLHEKPVLLPAKVRDKQQRGTWEYK